MQNKQNENEIKSEVKESLISFLERKTNTHRKSQESECSTTISQTSFSNNNGRKLLPSYRFVFDSYCVGEHVEYLVVMFEQYTILKRKITSTYNFKTRYSLLESLNEKIKEDFPGKKFFGNKEPSFINERKKKLEGYLNKVAAQRNVEFLKFVMQIKEIDFRRGLKEKFVLR